MGLFFMRTKKYVDLKKFFTERGGHTAKIYLSNTRYRQTFDSKYAYKT